MGCGQTKNHLAEFTILWWNACTVVAIWVSTRITSGYFEVKHMDGWRCKDWFTSYLAQLKTGVIFSGFGNRCFDYSFGVYLELDRKGQLPVSIPCFLSDQDLMECFLHVWCIPHHNSIRQVWASVCIHAPGTCGVYIYIIIYIYSHVNVGMSRYVCVSVYVLLDLSVLRTPFAPRSRKTLDADPGSEANESWGLSPKWSDPSKWWLMMVNDG